MSDNYLQYSDNNMDYRNPAIGANDDAKTAGMIVAGAVFLLALLGGVFRKFL